MKRYNKVLRNWIIALGILTFTATGCKDEMLEKVPTSRIPPEVVFSTTENAYTAINGMHRQMYRQWYSRQAVGGQSANMLYMEVLGEDFVMTARANGWFISEYGWQTHRNANSAMVRDSWGFYYVFIGNANQIIASIDDAEGPESDRNFIKAQALTYRAWSYFQLVQMFGERYVRGGDNSSDGVPIVLEPSTDAVPRDPVEDVYAQINQDLNDAIDFFSQGTNRPNKSHLNIDVARGLKARVALTQQNWEDAASFANQAKQGYRLLTEEEHLAGFSDYTTPEWMWGIHQREDQPTYFYSYFAYVGNFSSTNTRGNPKAINSELYDEISDTDVRKQLWDPTGADEDFPLANDGVRRPYMTRKFLLSNPGNSNGDLAFMRGAEMYLIEAEALARLERYSDAADVLYDLIITRDPDYTKSTNTGNALIEEILTHRRIELWGEGFRFLDLKRLNMPLNRRGANHQVDLAVVMEVPAGAKEWQFLIPEGELNRTLDVVRQNPL